MEKGISDSLVMIILLVVSVVMVIGVISIAFNFLSFYPSGEVRQVGTAYAYTNGTIKITLRNTFQDAKIIQVVYNGTVYELPNSINLFQGINTYEINTNFKFSPQVVSLEIIIEVNNGQSTVYLPVSAQLVYV